MDDSCNIYRLEWSDIKDGRYNIRILIDSNAEDFYAVDRRIGVLNKDGLAKQPGKRAVDLKQVDKSAN